MSEMGEIFNDWRKVKQEKRASNTEQSTEILRRSGVVFSSPNGGAHLVVLAGPHVVDSWPSTGLWIIRKAKTNARRRGVRKLVEFVEKSRVMDAL
jgi:hypothetical protein